MLRTVSRVATAFICFSLIACGGGGSGSDLPNPVAGSTPAQDAGGSQPNPNLSVPLRMAVENYVKSDFSSTFSITGTAGAESPAPVSGSGRWTKGAGQPVILQGGGQFAGMSALLSATVITGSMTVDGKTSSIASTSNLFFNPTTLVVMARDDGKQQYEYLSSAMFPETVKAGAAGALGTANQLSCGAFCFSIMTSYAVEPDSANTLLVKIIDVTEKSLAGRDESQTVYRIDASGNISLVSTTQSSIFDGKTLQNVTYTFGENQLSAPPASATTATPPSSSTSTGSASSGPATGGSSSSGSSSGSTLPGPGAAGSAAIGSNAGGTTGGTTATTGTTDTAPAPASGNSSAASGPVTPAFQAALVSAPADGEYICGLTNLVVQGSGIKNVELLPPNGYTPKYAVFNVSPDGTQAQMTLNPRSFPNGELLVRISAYDMPSGQAGQEIVVMTARKWLIANDTWPCQSPGSLSAGH